LDHGIVCLFVLLRTKRHTILWSKEKEQKDIQYYGLKKKNKKTYNTMVQRKRTKRHTIPWSKEKEQKDIQYYGLKKNGKKDIQYHGPKKKNKKTYNTMD
jgi:hypothetical protein